jgi:hypothetical protein
VSQARHPKCRYLVQSNGQVSIHARQRHLIIFDRVNDQSDIWYLASLLLSWPIVVRRRKSCSVMHCMSRSCQNACHNQRPPRPRTCEAQIHQTTNVYTNHRPNHLRPYRSRNSSRTLFSPTYPSPLRPFKISQWSSVHRPHRSLVKCTPTPPVLSQRPRVPATPTC